MCVNVVRIILKEGVSACVGCLCPESLVVLCMCFSIRGLAFSSEGGPKYTGGHKFLERKIGGS